MTTQSTTSNCTSPASSLPQPGPIITAAQDLPAIRPYPDPDMRLYVAYVRDFPEREFTGASEAIVIERITEARALRLKHLAHCPEDAPLVLAGLPHDLAVAIERAALAGAAC